MYKKILNFWQEKKISSVAELESAIDGKIISLAYHSGKIENNFVTYNATREIFEHDGVVKYTGDLRTLFEIKNAKDAFKFFLRCFREKKSLDKNFILKLHKELTKNTYNERRWKIGERPGTFKKNDYVIGINETGALPEDVDEEISELLEEINFSSEDKIITVAAYFHAKFENIHPFADGNGRVGRLALNYFLVCKNHPPIIIHEEDRNEYFAALESWDTEQKLDPMKNFLIEQTVKTWQKNIFGRF